MAQGRRNVPPLAHPQFFIELESRPDPAIDLGNWVLPDFLTSCRPCCCNVNENKANMKQIGTYFCSESDKRNMLGRLNRQPLAK